MDIKKMVGLNIKALREKQHIKQTAFAQRLKVSEQYLSQIENGRKDIGIERLCEIAGYFNVSVASLVSQSLTVIPDHKEIVYDKLLMIIELFHQSVNRSYTDYEFVQRTEQIISQQNEIITQLKNVVIHNPGE